MCKALYQYIRKYVDIIYLDFIALCYYNWILELLLRYLIVYLPSPKIEKNRKIMQVIGIKYVLIVLLFAWKHHLRKDALAGG